MLIHERIDSVLAKVLGRPAQRFAPESTLREELGLDSTEMVEIVAGVEKEFDLRFGDGIEHGLKLVSDLYTLVESAVPQRRAV